MTRREGRSDNMIKSYEEYVAEVKEYTDAELLDEYWSMEDTSILWDSPDTRNQINYQSVVCGEMERRGL